MKRIEKPWGHEEWLVVGQRVCMKRLVIAAGKRFSLQFHEVKEEAWLFTRGHGVVTLGDRTLECRPGDVLHVRPGVVHRIEAKDEIELIEASTPELEDVVRLADDFGRGPRDTR
jgi:mannose-6-phosphate isomerase-like protein (cupin superfamily)